MNNFVGGQDSSGKGKSRDNAQSHSPSGLHASGGKQGSILQGGGKVKKGLKVINNSSKSPYLNNVFTKNGLNTQSTTTQQSATETSSQSSSKASRKGAASAEISDSSFNVLKKINKSQVQGAIQTIGAGGKPVNAKLLAAIQRANKNGVASNTSSINKQQSSSQQSAMSNSVVDNNSSAGQGHNISNTNCSVNLQHKKNSKSQNRQETSKFKIRNREQSTQRW